MEIASLQIAIDSRQTKTAKEWLDDLSRSGERAEKSMGKVGAGGKVAATGTRQAADASRASARAMDTQASSAQRLTSMIRSYAAAMVGAFGVREIVQAADSWQGLENRLRLVTQTNTQLRASMNDVYSIAQRTSSTLDSTAQVYQRFAQNAGGLGLTMADVARVTETVSKAVAYSGSTAAGAEGALIQFGQALASGALRGEELQSVLDGASGLAQALADGMGVPVGALKDLASEGKITGDVIVEALTRAKDSVDEQFNTRIKTVGQSFTELGNAVTRYIGEMSGATGASNGLAGSISSVADAIDRARENMDGLHRELDAFRTFGELVSEAWGAIDQFGKDLQEMLGTSDSDVRSLGDTILTSFEESFLATAREVDALHDAFFGTLASLGAGFRTLGENIVTGIKWAFDWAKFYFDSILFEFQQVMAATTGQSYDMRLPSQPESQPFFKSMREEADKARQAVEGTLGVTAALQARLGTKANWRSFEDAFDIPLVDEFGKALGRVPPNLDKTGKALSAAAKAAQQFEQQRRTYLRSQYQEISNLSDQADALEDQVRYYGLSESALNDLTIARLREQQAALSGFVGAEEEIAILQRMIDQYERLGLNMRKLEQKEAEKAAWESWSRDVEQIFQQVGQSLTDAIFEGGKSGRDLVKDLFKTLTLRVLINPVMNSIQGAVTNSLGSVFGLQNPQQGGVMGTVSNLGSAYNAASGGLTGNISNVANWFGEKAGSTALQSFASGLSATFGFSAPVAATGGVASLAGVTAGPGLAASLGSGASGVIGGSAAGIGSAIGAALPWVGGALAIGSLLGGSLFGDDEPKTRHGQRTTIDYMGGRFGVSAVDDRQAAGSEQAALAAAQASVTAANELFAKLGVDAAIESFYAVMESSVLGDRQGVASGGMLRTGGDLRQIGIRQSSDMTFAGFGGWSSAEMLPRLATDIQLSILEAFQTQVDSLPDVLADMIRGVDVRALDAAGAQDLAARFSAMVQGVTQFQTAVESLPFDQLRELSFGAAAGLIEAAGGLERLTGNLNTYYQNFYSESERAAKQWGDISKALADVGVGMPETKEQFRALVEAQDLTTESGQRAYAALLEVSGAFAQVADASARAAQEAIAQAQATAQARLGLQNQIDAALGNTAALRERELEAMDASLRPMQEYLWAVQDAQAAAERQYQSDMQTYQQQLAHWQGLQNAVTEAFSEVRRIATEEMTKLREAATQTNTAMGYLRERVSAQESLLNRFISGLEGIYSSIRDVFDYLDDQIRDLRGQSAGGMQAREGWQIIGEAISSGIIPDAEKLQQAVGAVRAEMDSTDYASAFERDRASMLLASRLEQIQGVAEPQMSFAQQQIEIAKQQLKALEDSLIEAQKAVNESRGIKDNTGDLGPAGEQVDRLADLWAESQTQVLALADIVGNTSVTERLFDQVLDAITYEEWANREIDGINAQLDLAQKQYDEFRGLNSKATTMIQALNNMASALDAAAVAQPTQPTPTQPGTVTPPPAPTVPDYFYSAAQTSGFSDSQIKGRRLYMPGSFAEARDYSAKNTDVYVEYMREVQKGNIVASNAAYLQFMQQHWTRYGQHEGTVRAYADGGYYPGGWALVGEEGPELVNFRQPGMVYTAAQSANLMGSANDALIAEVRGLREEVSMLRYEARATAINTGKQARIMDDVTQGGTAIRTEVAA